MTCDDTLLELGQPTLSDAVKAHLDGCEACRAAHAAVTAAALPPLSPEDEVRLERLADRTWARWQAPVAPPRRWPSVLALAAAAGVGALLASAGFLARGSSTRGPEVTPVVLEQPGPSSLEANLGDEQVFFEVSWPSIPDEPGELDSTSEGEL